MKAAAYARVSSKAQNLAMQEAAVVRAAQARGDEVGSWYREKVSGAKLARPELQRLREDVRAGKVRRLYVFRIDRLTRSGIRDTFEVIEQLRAHGCEVVSVADGFDLQGPAAEVVLAVMAWAAKMERLAINERISAARERLRAEGRAWGRPPRLTAQDCEKVRQLRERGLSIRTIATRLRIHRSSVARASQKVASEYCP